MSSTTYWAEIRPDLPCRRLVLIAGSLLALAGVPVILSLPVGPWPMLLLQGFWLAWSGRELVLLWRAQRRCSGYRLAAGGELQIWGAGGARPASLMPGSVVLHEIAWLRIRDEQGRVWGELIRGKHRESEEWRRFQVIFRHLNTC